MENYYRAGLAFILKKQTALSIPGIHFSPLHWTEKQGNRQGRPIGDCSDGGSEMGNEPLNSSHTKQESDSLWGVIKHPSINCATVMIIKYYERSAIEDPSIQWNEITLFKKDLKGAFTLLFFDAGDYHHRDIIDRRVRNTTVIKSGLISRGRCVQGSALHISQVPLGTAGRLPLLCRPVRLPKMQPRDMLNCGLIVEQHS